MKPLMTWAMRTALLCVSLFVILATLSGPKSPLGSLALTPSDKLTHFMAFYLIALLGAVSFPSGRLLLTAACVLVLGLALELLQGLVGREPSIKDALFNVAGIAMALVPFAAARLTLARAHATHARSSSALDRADQSPPE